MSCVSSSLPQQLGWPEPFPGQHFPHHPVDLRPRDPVGIFFPPSLLQAQQKSSAHSGTGPRGDASRPRCGSRTRPGLRRFSPGQTPFLYANGSLPRMPGVSNGVSCGALEGSRRGSLPSRFRRADGQVDYRRACACWSVDPLGAEKVAAWPLASLGHRNLTPGLLRQLVAALLHGPALAVSSLDLRRTPESLILRTGPGRLRRPHRKARRNVQHVPHPAKAARPSRKDGDIPIRVVRRDPSSLQVGHRRTCARSTISKANSVLDR